MWPLDDVEPFCSPAPAWGDGSTWPRVFENEVFIIKLLPVDGFASGAVVVGEVAGLTHELGDDAVEAAPFEAEAFLVGAEAAEILCMWAKGREMRAASQLEATTLGRLTLSSPTVMGTTSERRRICSRPAGLFPILMSM